MGWGAEFDLVKAKLKPVEWVFSPTFEWVIFRAPRSRTDPTFIKPPLFSGILLAANLIVQNATTGVCVGGRCAKPGSVSVHLRECASLKVDSRLTPCCQSERKDYDGDFCARDFDSRVDRGIGGLPTQRRPGGHPYGGEGAQENDRR